ncbi:MAG: mercury(II) reductase [Candidatus Helarchaeota archaeon]
MIKQHELIILGGGAAGFSAATKANELNVKTLLINNDFIGIGGTCVNVGCLPTKHLLYISKLIHYAKYNNFDGLKISTSFNFKTIFEKKDELVTKLRTEKYEKVLNQLENVTFIEGNAKFVSKNEINTNKESYKANKFIIATGSSTIIPPIDGINSVDYLTNKEILNLKELPESMIVIGGGPLGVEFSQMFSRFGTKIYLLQRADRIIRKAEDILSKLLQEYLQAEGIDIHTNADVKKISKKNNKITAEFEIDRETKVVEADQLLVAAGRKPNTSNLGLEYLDIQLGNKGEIIVNEEMQVKNNVWAAGDVTGDPMLETVAAREGMIAANNAFSTAKIKMDYRVFPSAVFTDPQLAQVGLTDEEANKRGYNCNCRTIPLEVVPKAQAIKDLRGAIKIVVNNDNQQILGIHLLAPQAADIIHEAVLIIKHKMTIDDVIETIHVFPTLSEIIKIGAQSFRRDINKMSCCVE